MLENTLQAFVGQPLDVAALEQKITELYGLDLFETLDYELVRDGDQVEVKEKSKQLVAVLDAAQSGERDVPEYIEVDHRAMRGRFLRAPKLTDVPYPVQMEPNLVVEFYSR